MKLKAGTIVTVKLDDKEYQFLLVHAGGDGKERLSLEAPLARLLGAMAVGDTLTWQPPMPGTSSAEIRVKLVGVEEGA